MAVKPVNMNKLTPKHNARHIGAASGMLAGSAYILKNRKDIFVEAGKKAAAELGYTNNKFIEQLKKGDNIVMLSGLCGKFCYFDDN